MKNRPNLSRKWLVSILILFGVLAVIHVYWERFTGDEGFYALSARNVLHGMKPYRDFLFQQMPLLPYVYAVWFKVFGTSIVSGRLLSAVLGLSSVALIALACERRGGRLAGIVGGLLVVCNLSFIFDVCTLHTQPLTVFLTSCAIYVLSKPRTSHELRDAAIALFFMSSAFLARLSILPILLLLWIYLGWLCR